MVVRKESKETAVDIKALKTRYPVINITRILVDFKSIVANFRRLMSITTFIVKRASSTLIIATKILV